MQIKILVDTFIAEGCPNPTRGEVRTVSDAFGQHLIANGLAMALKIEEPFVKKSEAPSSVSQVDRALTSETAPLRKGKRIKP